MRRVVAILAVLLAGFCVIGPILFLIIIPPPGPAPQAAAEVPCMVVFSGRIARLKAAMRVLSAQRSRWLLISGTLQGADPQILKRVRALDPQMYDARVELGRAARDTAGNARETEAFAARHACGKVRLVTDDVHMPRSLLLLRRDLRHTVVVPYAVAMLRDPSLSIGARLHVLGSEYLKTLVTLLRLPVQGTGSMSAPSGNRR